MRHNRPSPGPDMQVVAGFGLGVLGVLSAEHGRGWLKRGHELFCETLARSFLARPAAGWPGPGVAGAAVTPPCSFSRPASLNQQAVRTLAWPMPRLAAQHQDNEDDNYNENNGSDTDIHVGIPL
jgi:hypothetical protein